MHMKTFTKILISASCLISTIGAMAAPPKLMILPDKTWCMEKGYVTETQRNGKPVVREDYDKALIDKDFQNVSLAIKQIMAERGFPMVDALAQMEADDEDEMLDEAFEGAESGSAAATNAYDEILKRAKPDITLKLGWDGSAFGTTYNMNYRLEAVDSYSNKSVAPIAGSTGDMRRSVPLAAALKQTAKNNMDQFCVTLNDYFQDLQDNGREIRLDVRILDNGDGTTMNSEFGGKELGDIIYEWVSDNTVNHQFTQRAGRQRNMQRYDQVRIPMFDSAGKPQDAARWVNGLRQHLNSLGLKSENASSGIGAARIYIGEK